MKIIFYNAFRNSVRILLRKHKHIKTREILENIINNNKLLYLDKLDKIYEKIRILMKPHVKFSSISTKNITSYG